MEPYYELFFMLITLLIVVIIFYFLIKLNILLNLNIKLLKKKIEKIEKMNDFDNVFK